MNLLARQCLSAAGVLAIVLLLGGGALVAAFALRDEQTNVSALTLQYQALAARTQRVAPDSAAEPESSPFLEAKSLTRAGAVLQQRVVNAVSLAGGRLSSSRVDVDEKAGKNRVALEVELTIAQTDMQKMLFNLETGRPYLFVEAFEARTPEGDEGQGPAVMHVSLTLSGVWGGPR